MLLSLQILWAFWLIGAFICVLQTRKLWRRFLREPAHKLHSNLPPAWIIVPFKGLDADLPACIQSLCSQNYPRYQLLLIVESTSDPAYPILQHQLSLHPHIPSQILVAGISPLTQSQKVHNLLHALSHILSRCDDADILAFADSDAIPGPNWLLELASPACDDQNIALSTGYRWMIPIIPSSCTSPTDNHQPSHSSPSLFSASTFASVINSSIACTYRNRLTSRAWGGSMALRARVAKQGNLLSYWQNSLSDDYQITRMAWQLNRRIWFVPRCLAPSPTSFSFPQLFSFARRQYLITRIYTPKTFAIALLCFSWWLLSFLSAWLTLALCLLSHPIHPFWLQPAIVLLTVAFLHQLRFIYRRRIVQTAFPPATIAALATPLKLDRWFTPLWMTLHTLFMYSALFGRTIRWRNVRYRLHAPQNIQRL